MNVALQRPARMTVAAFLAWDAPPGRLWQLVDGTAEAMAPTSRTHGTIQAELGSLIREHLRNSGRNCVVVSNPGVIPQAGAGDNFRIPDLGVTCTEYEPEEYDLSEPILLIEILSPGKYRETWANVRAYLSIPNLQEILLVETETIGAALFQRGPDGAWPAEPQRIAAGTLTLASIDFAVPLAGLYRGTRLARGGAQG